MNQQPPSFTLDGVAAREGSGSTGMRISETGAYKGVITRAEWLTASTGAQLIQIDFETQDQSSSNNMELYILNKDGEYIFGYKKLQALMSCLKVRDLKPAQATVKKFDLKKSQEVTQQGIIYPDLMNKPVGLLLQRVEYYKHDNTIGYSMDIFAPFNVKTMQTADEMWDEKEPKKLDMMINSVKDKKPKNQQQQNQVNTYDYQQTQNNQNQASSYDQFDDGIPF